MWNAAYMALVVIAWAFAIAIAGAVAFFLVEMTLELYEEHFKHW